MNAFELENQLEHLNNRITDYEFYRDNSIQMLKTLNLQKLDLQELILNEVKQ